MALRPAGLVSWVRVNGNGAHLPRGSRTALPNYPQHGDELRGESVVVVEPTEDRSRNEAERPVVGALRSLRPLPGSAARDSVDPLVRPRLIVVVDELDHGAPRASPNAARVRPWPRPHAALESYWVHLELGWARSNRPAIILLADPAAGHAWEVDQVDYFCIEVALPWSPPDLTRAVKAIKEAAKGPARRRRWRAWAIPIGCVVGVLSAVFGAWWYFGEHRPSRSELLASQDVVIEGEPVSLGEEPPLLAWSSDGRYLAMAGMCRPDTEHEGECDAAMALFDTTTARVRWEAPGARAAVFIDAEHLAWVDDEGVVWTRGVRHAEPPRHAQGVAWSEHDHRVPVGFYWTHEVDVWDDPDASPVPSCAGEPSDPSRLASRLFGPRGLGLPPASIGPCFAPDGAHVALLRSSYDGEDLAIDFEFEIYRLAP